MKIGPPSDSPSVNLSPALNAQKMAQSAAETAKSTGTAEGVSVSVSVESAALDKPESSTSGDIDMAKVNTMKAAIRNGTFTVNPQVIADKMLSNAQEMISGPTN